jgi:hypothetical protein
MAVRRRSTRAAQLLVRVVESARPLGVGELAEPTELPKSTTSRARRRARAPGPPAARRRPRPCAARAGPPPLRPADRSPTSRSSSSRTSISTSLAEESGETVNLGVPTPLGVDQLSQRGQPALHRLHELGREACPVPPDGERQGLPRLGRGGLRARQPEGSGSDSRTRLRDGRRRARGRPDRARGTRLRRDGSASQRFRSPGRRSA